jgi:hypothetical protein
MRGLLFLQAHRETDLFITSSGVQVAQHDCGLFHFHRVVFSSQIKKKVARTLVKTVDLSVNLNIDGTPITSRTHTHKYQCGNVYPYTVSDDRLGRNKKRKDNGKRIFPDEIVLGNLVIMRFFVHLCSEEISE